MDYHEGMSANERHYHFGLMDEFYKYVNQKNEKAAIDVLIQAKFSIERAKEIVSEIFKNLQFYD